MNQLSTKSRIALGQVALLSSVLLAATFLGIVPDRNDAILDGRAALCESLAIDCSVLAFKGGMPQLKTILERVAERNPDVLSLALRRSTGKIVVEVGEHVANWQPPSQEHSSESHVLVPIRNQTQSWGNLEVRFRPLTPPGWIGWLLTPWTRLIVFVSAACYVAYFLYLSKMLQVLDPSKTVPNRVRSALDTLAEGLLVIDKQGRIVLANQAFSEMIGRAPEKLVGTLGDQLPWIWPEGQSAPLYPWIQAIRDEQPQINVMLRLADKDSRERTFIVNCSPVLGHNGKYRGVLVSFEDVTELEQNKVELSRSKEAAEEANRAKSEFLARMSHEIRTPMNAILGFTDVLRRGFDVDKAERHDYLNTIHSSGEHLLALINDILDLSKIESGRLEPELSRHAPHQLISQVVTVLKQRAQEKGLSLDYRVEGLMPETIVTDSVRMRQMLMNLVGNALKFTDQGGVRVVARLDQTHEPPRFELRVVDTGVGIAAAALDKIFDPFAQADTSITRRFGGTGLGLTISRQLAQALGGDIKVESQLGVGSTFTVTIDPGSLEGVPLLDGSQLQVRLEQTTAQAPTAQRLPPATILVADDGDANRKLITLVLTRAGVTVETAVNGQMAVEMAEAKQYDLILMDMQMPIMDGYTATSLLRERGFTLPILALTAHAMQGDEEKCRAAGCSGFLTKPINMDRLLQTLAVELSMKTLLSDLPDDANQPDVAQATAEPSVESIVESLSELPTVSATTVDNDPPCDAPIVSRLPTDDPEFREIVVEFVATLHDKLAAMQAAMAGRNYADLARLAHWLKGSGGTAGFHELTAPALTLEQAAKAAQPEAIELAMAKLARLVGRIVISGDVELVDSIAQ